MVESGFLLNLLQFVALVAPALAILMQVVLTVEDDRNLEVGPFSIDELRILQLSLVSILVGGAIIGGQLITFVNNLSITVGMVLIFGGLPFSAVAVFLMANKTTYAGKDSSTSLYEQIKENFTTAILIMLVAGLPAMVYFWLYEYTRKWVNTTFNFGFLYEGIVTPSLFLGAGFIIMVGKSLLTLSKYEIQDLNTAIRLGVRNSIFLPLLFIIFVAIPYAIGYYVTHSSITRFNVGKPNPLLSIIHIWSGTLYYVIFAHDYDPLQED